MKKIIKIGVLAFALIIASNSTIKAQAQPCATMPSLQNSLKKDSTLAITMKNNEVQIEKWIKNHAQTKNDTLIIIPVVFHVLWNTDVQNISDAQIMSQITALNENYRRTTADTVLTPDVFKPVAADIKVEFRLANIDTNGVWMHGITRTYTTKTFFDVATNDAKFTSQGGYNIWNPNQYLNIWTAPDIKNAGAPGVLGYAQFPGGDSITDGVVLKYDIVGSVGAIDASYGYGRTAVHEIGHWLNLYHIWGDDGTACTGSDSVADTPNQGGFNSGCPTFPHISCQNSPNGDMFMNYMDYTQDRCLNMFTLGQKARMRATLSTVRHKITTSTKYDPSGIDPISKSLNFRIFPNPAADQTLVEWSTLELKNKVDIKVLDITGKTIFQQELNPNQKSITINTSRFNNGLYLIQLSSDNKIKVEKLIIQH